MVEYLHERHAAAPHRAVTFRDMADYLKCRPGNVHSMATRLRVAGWLDTGRRLALTPAARAMLEKPEPAREPALEKALTFLLRDAPVTP